MKELRFNSLLRALFMSLLLAPEVFATVRVKFDYTLEVFVPVEGLPVDMLRQLLTEQLGPEVEQSVTEILDNYDFEPFLGAMANAGFNSMHGLRTDYASDFDYFTLGLGGGAGVSFGGQSLSEITAEGFEAEDEFPAVGFNVSLSLMLGISLKKFDVPNLFKKFNVYANAFYLSFDIPIQESDYEIEVKNLNLGLNIQYTLCEATAKFLGTVKWNGLKVGSGLNYQSSLIALPTIQFSFVESELDINLADREPVSLISSYDFNLIVGTDSKLFTIPSDISTGIRLFYFLTLYIGLGMDFIFGSTNLNLDNQSSLTTTYIHNDVSMPVHRAGTILTVDVSRAPLAFNFRLFGGVQLEIWSCKLFTQITHDFVGKTYALSLGVKIVY